MHLGLLLLLHVATPSCWCSHFCLQLPSLVHSRPTTWSDYLQEGTVFKCFEFNDSDIRDRYFLIVIILCPLNIFLLPLVQLTFPDILNFSSRFFPAFCSFALNLREALRLF